jgi:hypothetical protein
LQAAAIHPYPHRSIKSAPVSGADRQLLVDRSGKAELQQANNM